MERARAVKSWRAFAAAGFAAFTLAATGVASAQSEGRVGEILRQVGVASGAVSQRDAARGLREALTLGAESATSRLGRVDGFFKDPVVRIPLPGGLADVQRSLRPLGLAGSLDDLELRLNRGAEAAMPEAKRLLVDAVRSITISDALSIVRGGDDAATRYLRARTEARLTDRLRPIMRQALMESGAFVALEQAANRAGMSGRMGQWRQDLVDGATRKALDGVFHYVAEEERAIRADPAKRTTDVLRRVFAQRR